MEEEEEKFEEGYPQKVQINLAQSSGAFSTYVSIVYVIINFQKTVLNVNIYLFRLTMFTCKSYFI